MSASKITLKDVQHIARLANLSLSPEELASTASELEKILGFVADLSNASLENVESIAEGAAISVERPDVVQESLTPASFLSEAPASVGTAFQVPRIIEQEH